MCVCIHIHTYTYIYVHIDEDVAEFRRTASWRFRDTRIGTHTIKKEKEIKKKK